MISMHTGKSITAFTLILRGAIIKRIANTDMCSVEFPSRNGVGPISGTWKIETDDEADIIDQQVKK